MVLFLTCWLPFHVIFLLLKVHWLSFTELPEWSLCLIQVLVVVYPSLSPCIFAFRCKKLQRELKRMLRKNAAAAKINADLPTNTRKRSSFRPPEFTKMTLKKPNITRHSSLAVSSIPRDMNQNKCSTLWTELATYGLSFFWPWKGKQPQSLRAPINVIFERSNGELLAAKHFFAKEDRIYCSSHL